MPLMKQPLSLKSNCLESIYNNLDSHWLKEDGEIKKIFDSSKISLYYIGPFECLNDENVDYLLKKLYKSGLLNKNHFFLLLHNRLRKLDFTYVKKHSLMSNGLCYFMGNNCFNLVELNLFAQNDLTAKNLCDILYSMRNLKKLNLSHTQANLKVTKVIATTCKKLESLYLENCRKLYDDCIEEIANELWPTLKDLNLDNVFLSGESAEKILLTCKNLRFFYISHLPTVIKDLFDREREYQETTSQLSRHFNLETFYIDSQSVLKPDLMQSIAFTCPNLKTIQINCAGSRSSLSYIGNFSYLTDLTLANTTSLMSFRFGGYLLDALKNSIGKQLKSLHLIYIVDVNLRSISKYCPNLIKLNVEFLGYYEPSLDEENTTNSVDYENYYIRSLRHLTISNVNSKFEQIHLNIGQFKKDLTLLLKNGCVKYLELMALNELNDEYFQTLFTTPAPKYYLGSGVRYLHENIDTLELKLMNSITADLIENYLLNNPKNCLKNINLQECKLIGKADNCRFKKIIDMKKFDCNIKWS